MYRPLASASRNRSGPVPKSNIGDRIARLTARKMKEAGAAVSFALGLNDD
jgi:hypothetical protein